MVSAELSARECGRPVMALRGDLDVLDTASVSAAVTTALSRHPDLILDLAGLEFIDCAALSALLRLQQAARQSGGDLLLAAPQPAVSCLLAITGLDGVFSIHASARDAAAAAPGLPPGGGARRRRQPFRRLSPESQTRTGRRNAGTDARPRAAEGHRPDPGSSAGRPGDSWHARPIGD